MSISDRPLRADALRNREKLVAAAREAFTVAHSPVALEDIARAAGVGIGTLYRNFPTREALVEAVYASGLDEVTASASTLLDRFAPDVALRAWIQNYADFTATKRGMADVLKAGWAAGRLTTTSTRERITASIASILTAGAESGELRPDVDPDDVTAMLLGIFLSTAPGSTQQQTARLLDLVVDALRTR